jgi:hypothetical protein
MNLERTRILRTTVGITARVEATVRTGAIVKTEIIRVIRRIRETKKSCSTRGTTRWNKKAT